MTDMYSSGEYARKQPGFHVEDAPWKARHIRAMLEKHGLHPARVVDIGCGAGAILKELQAALSPDTVFEGYDIAPEGIGLARQHENERLHFFCDDIAAIPDGGFDLVLCIDVFEHIEDYLGFLRILRDKGTYKLFHIPLDMTVLSVLRNSQAYTAGRSGTCTTSRPTLPCLPCSTQAMRSSTGPSRPRASTRRRHAPLAC